MASKHLSNTLLYTISSSLPTATALAILPFSINLLSLNDNGMLAILLAATSLFQIIITGGTDSYVSIESARAAQQNTPITALIKSAIRLQALTALALGIVLVLIIPSLSSFNVHITSDTAPVLLGITWLTAFLNSIFKTFTASLVGQSKAGAHATYNFLVALSLVVATIACSVWMEDKLLALVLARCISGAVGLLIVVLRTPMFSSTAHAGVDVGSLWKFSWPITTLLLLLWISSFSDRFIVELKNTSEQVALLDLAAKFVLVLDIVQQAMSNAIIPLAYGAKDDEKHHQKIHTLFSAFTVSTVVLAMAINLCAPVAIALLIHHPQYAYSGQLVGLLSLGMLFRPLYYFYVFAFYAQKKVKPLAGLFIVPTLVQFVATYPIAEHFGLPGVAIAFGVGRIAQVLVLHYFHRTHVEVPPFNAAKFLGLPLMVVLICGVGEFFIFRGAPLYAVRSVECVMVMLVIWRLYRAQWPALKAALLARKQRGVE